MFSFFIIIDDKMISSVSPTLSSPKSALQEAGPVERFKPSDKHEWILKDSHKISFLNFRYNSGYVNGMINAVFNGNVEHIKFDEKDLVNLCFHEVTLRADNKQKKIRKIRLLAIAAFLGSQQTVELLLPLSNQTTFEDYLSWYLREDLSNQVENLIHTDCHETIINHMVAGVSTPIFSYYEKCNMWHSRSAQKMEQLRDKCLKFQEDTLAEVSLHIPVKPLAQIIMGYLKG